MKINLGKYIRRDVFFDTDMADNHHIVHFGATGTGKTTQAVSIISQIVQQGGTVVALDAHSVLRTEEIHPALREGFCKYSNAIDVYNEGIRFPLLTPRVFEDGDFESETDTVDAVTLMIATALNFGARQTHELRQAIKKVMESGKYELKGIKAVGEALSESRRSSSMEVMERISQLTENNVFRPGNSFIEFDKINILRISKFSLITQNLITEVVLNLLWRMAVKGEFYDNGVYVFVDECHNLNLGKRGIINQLLAEGRKYNLNLILSTQVLPMDSHISKMMLQAALIQFFRPAVNEVAKVSRIIDADRSKEWQSVLRNLERGELIAMGSFVLGGGNLSKSPLRISAKL